MCLNKMAWEGRKVYELSEINSKIESYETLDMEKNFPIADRSPDVSLEEKNPRDSPDSDRYNEVGIVRDTGTEISSDKKTDTSISGVKEEEKEDAEKPTKNWKTIVKMLNLCWVLYWKLDEVYSYIGQK